MFISQDNNQKPTAALDAPKSVVIIGGSLSGLTFALACAHHGISTHVLEQAHGPRRRGGSLGVDRAALIRAIGGGAHPFPLLAGRRQAVAWQALYGWLRSETRHHPTIILKGGTKVTTIRRGRNHFSAIAADGKKFRSEMIVGADGYQSLVRRAINPDVPDPMYAGYLLWRGLVDETELSADCLPAEHAEAVLIAESGHRLVAYAVAGRTGSLVVGQRRISFTWYDAGTNGLLRDLGCTGQPDHALRTVPEEAIPSDTSGKYCTLARRLWPEPWRSIIVHAFRSRQVFATPVAEYRPRRLVGDRLAVIGDAAHVISPVMGLGFVSGIKDASVLADCLARHGTPAAALAEYEATRLPEARSLVQVSREWSRAFVNRWRREPTGATILKRP